MNEQEFEVGDIVEFFNRTDHRHVLLKLGEFYVVGDKVGENLLSLTDAKTGRFIDGIYDYCHFRKASKEIQIKIEIERLEAELKAKKDELLEAMIPDPVTLLSKDHSVEFILDYFRLLPSERIAVEKFRDRKVKVIVTIEDDS